MYQDLDEWPNWLKAKDAVELSAANLEILISTEEDGPALAAYRLSQMGDPDFAEALDGDDAAVVWFALRDYVPALVVRALDGDDKALSALLMIRRELDPTIMVPWRSLANVPQIELCSPPRAGNYVVWNRIASLCRPDISADSY